MTQRMPASTRGWVVTVAAVVAFVFRPPADEAGSGR